MTSLTPTLQSGSVVTTLRIEPAVAQWYFGTPAEHRVSVWTLLKQTVMCVALQKDDMPVAHDDKRVAIAGTAFGHEGITRGNT